MPKINKTDTRKELAKLAGVGHTGGLNPISDKVQSEPIHTTDELAKLAGVGHTAYHQAKTILDSDNEEIKQKVLSGNQHTGGLNPISDKVQSEPIHTTGTSFGRFLLPKLNLYRTVTAYPISVTPIFQDTSYPRRFS